MIKSLLSAIFGKSKTERLCDNNSNKEKIVGPFGQFAWGTSDLNAPSVDDANDIRYEICKTDKFHCLKAATPEIERECHSCIFLGIPITGIILQGKIGLKDDITAWFREKGETYCKKTFKCWPFDQPVPTNLLNSISPKEIFLYDYLSGLTRKKVFSVDSTPKSIKEHLKEAELFEIYKRLSEIGLLVSTENNSWSHADTKEAIESRKVLVDVSVLNSFYNTIESNTAHVARELSSAREYNLRLWAGTSNQTVPTVCPVCSRFPTTEIELPIDDRILLPFHFDCGRMMLACSNERFKEANPNGMPFFKL